MGLARGESTIELRLAFELRVFDLLSKQEQGVTGFAGISIDVYSSKVEADLLLFETARVEL